MQKLLGRGGRGSEEHAAGIGGGDDASILALKLKEECAGVVIRGKPDRNGQLFEASSGVFGEPARGGKFERRYDEVLRMGTFEEEGDRRFAGSGDFGGDDVEAVFGEAGSELTLPACGEIRGEENADRTVSVGERERLIDFSEGRWIARALGMPNDPGADEIAFGDGVECDLAGVVSALEFGGDWGAGVEFSPKDILGKKLLREFLPTACVGEIGMGQDEVRNPVEA